MVNTIATPDETSDVESPPPSAAIDNGDNVHPMIKIIEEKELAKTVFAVAIPFIGVIVMAGKDKLAKPQEHFILTLTVIGVAAIFFGMFLKGVWPKCSQILEALGIFGVVISFFSVAFFLLPVELAWVPGICIFFCLIAVAKFISQSYRAG